MCNGHVRCNKNQIHKSILKEYSEICNLFERFSVVTYFMTKCICNISMQYPGPEVIKLFSSSTQLSTKFILLINVKMPTIVGILTFISMINTTPERLKARNFFIFRYFSGISCSVEFNMKKVL